LCLPYLASSLVFSVFVTGRRRRGSADRSRKKFSRSSPVMVRAGGQGAGSSSAGGGPPFLDRALTRRKGDHWREVCVRTNNEVQCGLC
jgi:hypothetical protein